MTTKKTDTVSAGPNVMPIIILGLLWAAYLARGILSNRPVPYAALVVPLVTGLLSAYFVLEWLGIVLQFRSLFTDPIPENLPLDDRSGADRHAEAIGGRSMLHTRCRHLLRSWAGSGNAVQTIELAEYQSQRARAPFAVEALFVILLLGTLMWLGGSVFLTLLGFALFGLTLFARQGILTRIDGYIESHLLARLPSALPLQTVTAHDLGRAIGEQVNETFRALFPQPDAIATAMRSALDDGASSLKRELTDLHKKLGEQHASIVETWSNAARTTTTELRDVEKALATIVGDLTTGLNAHVEQMKTALGDKTRTLAADMGERTETMTKAWSKAQQDMNATAQTLSTQLQTMVKQSAEEAAKGVADQQQKLQQSLERHAQSVRETVEKLGAQLQAIGEMGANIDKMLHVQETVERATKEVTASEEFKQTLTALRAHLESADRLLVEAAKPRTIRLIENEPEGD